jgi:DNA-binding MarR family transcriptional regulator
MAEQHIGQLLGEVIRCMEADLQGYLRDAGHADVRPSHFAFFRHMRPEGLRLTELAERAHVTKQSVGELVTYLEARGNLERLPDARDGRVRIIRLTAQGEQSRTAAFQAIREIEATCARGVGARRVDELRRTLARIAEFGPESDR